MDQLLSVLGDQAKISINVTGATIQKPEFKEFLTELNLQYPKYTNHICIEITEQAAIHFDESLLAQLLSIRDLGYSFAIDDFSMGNTSIKYLETSIFDLIKLDGVLSRNVLKNIRSREIIASIAALAGTLDIKVLAEYVETKEQRELLEKVGCHLYQGYLYSPALPLAQLKEVSKVENR